MFIQFLLRLISIDIAVDIVIFLWILLFLMNLGYFLAFIEAVIVEGLLAFVILFLCVFGLLRCFLGFSFVLVFWKLALYCGAMKIDSGGP